MKWKNKEHEFDGIYSKYDDMLKDKKGISIFGCGEIGAFYSDVTIRTNLFRNFYDSKKTGEFKNYTIKNINDYDGDELLILCASRKNLNEMKDILHNAGYTEYDNYVVYDEFFSKIFPLLMLYKYDILYSDMIQLSMTERCILRCKKCAHGCNSVSITSEDLSFSDIKESIDNYFSVVDYVQYFLLIGGEPLLSNRLCDTVKYIGEKYRDRIGRLQISTNGLIKPKKELLEACYKYNVFFHISNYISAIPKTKSIIKGFIDSLNGNNIEYYLVPEDFNWTDYGFDHLDRGWKELASVFDNCKTECHEIRIDKIYYCIMARSVAENTKMNYGEDDYILLADKEKNELISKKVLFEYLQGYSEKGYLDMCNFCYGSERQNYPIPVAEQE